MMQKTLILLAACFVLVGQATAQSCDPTGVIETDPRAPINNHSPLKKNHFSWFDIIYPLNWVNNSLATQVDGPYFQINNPITNNLLDSKDMMPEDGWELVTKGNGFNDDGSVTSTPVTNPYVVLYNRYTGVLRVFFLIGDRLQNYNSMRVEVSFFSANQTSLLDLGEGVVKALDETFTRDSKVNGVHEYINDKFNWFYAEFPMNYDPCTCLYESKIQITPLLHTSYKLDIEGQTSGTIVDLNSNQKTVSKNVSFSNKVNTANTAQEKAVEFFKNTNEVIQTVQDAVASDEEIDEDEAEAMLDDVVELVEGSKTPDFLKVGLQALPWLSKAVSLFDFFIGGGKAAGSQQVRIQPLAINMSSKFKGTFETTHTFLPVIVKTPGSRIASNTTIEYPHYNKTMGLFNLLKQPNYALFSTMDVNFNTSWRMFKLNRQLTMVLNPEAGVDLVEILAAFSYERPKRINPSSYPSSAVITNSDLGYFNRTVYDEFQTFEGKSNTGREVWRTEYYKWCDVMNKHWWFLNGFRDGGSFGYDATGNFSIKFLIRLRRKTCPPGVVCQDILLVKKYKLKFVAGEINVSFDPADHCFLDIPNLTDSYDTQAFCNSAEYKGPRILQPRLAMPQENPTEGASGAATLTAVEGLYPNPASQTVTIKLNNSQNSTYNCVVTDITGRVHTSVRCNAKQGALQVNISHLPEGAYLIKVSSVVDGSVSRVFKFLKTRS